MLSIARFKALSALRRKPDQALDEDAAAQIEDEADDPEMAVAKKEKAAVLRECLSKLSAEHREVVDLVCTTTRSQWRKWRALSEYRKRPLRRECFMPARNCRNC
jgi:RNA polymerase sigma-70 factor, ECF subfamily